MISLFVIFGNEAVVLFRAVWSRCEQPPVCQSRLTWERIPDVTTPTAEHGRFLGFWKLVSNERRNESGGLVSSNSGQTGYIIYTAAGFMMVHMVRPNRKSYAGAQPTADEAREALTTYTNYFGPFYIHEADGYVVHDQVGSLNVGGFTADIPIPSFNQLLFIGGCFG